MLVTHIFDFDTAQSTILHRLVHNLAWVFRVNMHLHELFISNNKERISKLAKLITKRAFIERKAL